MICVLISSAYFDVPALASKYKRMVKCVSCYRGGLRVITVATKQVEIPETSKGYSLRWWWGGEAVMGSCQLKRPWGLQKETGLWGEGISCLSEETQHALREWNILNQEERELAGTHGCHWEQVKRVERSLDQNQSQGQAWKGRKSSCWTLELRDKARKQSQVPWNPKQTQYWGLSLGRTSNQKYKIGFESEYLFTKRYHDAWQAFEKLTNTSDFTKIPEK